MAVTERGRYIGADVDEFGRKRLSHVDEVGRWFPVSTTVTAWVLGTSRLGTDTFLVSAVGGSAALSGTATIAAVGINILARSVGINATGTLEGAPRKVLLRSVAISATATIAGVGSGGTPSTVTYDSATVTYDALNVTYEGVVEGSTKERPVDFAVVASVTVQSRLIVSRSVGVAAKATINTHVFATEGFVFAVFGIVDRPDYFETHISPDSIDAEVRPSMFVLAGRPSSFSETDQARD